MQVRHKVGGRVYACYGTRDAFRRCSWITEFLIYHYPPNGFVWTPTEEFEPVPEQVADILEAAVVAGKETLDRLVAVLNAVPENIEVEIESDPITGVSSQGHIERRKCGWTSPDRRCVCDMEAKWVVGHWRRDNPIYSCDGDLRLVIIAKEEEQPGETLYVKALQRHYREY